MAGLTAIVALGVAELWWAVGAHSYHDLRVYQGALEWWTAGGDLYTYVMPPANRYGFTYPPFTAILLAPLSLMPTRAASLGTVAATVGATVMIASQLTHRLPRQITIRRGHVHQPDRQHRQRRRHIVAIASLAMLGLFATRMTLAEGQINMYVLALVVADLSARSAGRWHGVGVGLAAAIKLTPAVFIVYLFLAGRRRSAAIAGATFTACGLLGVVLAPHESIDFWTHVLWQIDRVGDAGSPSNESVRGLLARAMTDDVTLWWLAIVGLLTVIWWRRVRRATMRGDHAGALAITGVFACLVSPITWIHHQVFLIPALAVLADWALESRTTATVIRARRNSVDVRRAVAILVYLMLVIPLNGIIQTGNRPTGLIIQNVYVWITLALFLMLPTRDASKSFRLDSAPAQPQLYDARIATRD